MSNKQFISYLMEWYDEEDYKNYADGYICDGEYGQYLLPYLYAYDSLPEKEQFQFKLFLNTYLEKGGIEDMWDGSVSSLSNDIVLCMAFIVAAQYYFL